VCVCVEAVELARIVPAPIGRADLELDSRLRLAAVFVGFEGQQRGATQNSLGPGDLTAGRQVAFRAPRGAI